MKNMDNNKDYGNDLFDVIGKAFDILGFNVDEETVKDLGQVCKDKVCQCKENLGKKIDEKKEEVKRMITSTSEMREFLDGEKYTLQVVATGYNENMVQVHVDPNAGTITIGSSVDADAVWFMPNIEMTVNLPEGIVYESLKKNIANGLITVTGDVRKVTKERDTFVL